MEAALRCCLLAERVGESGVVEAVEPVAEVPEGLGELVAAEEPEPVGVELLEVGQAAALLLAVAGQVRCSG